MYPVMRNFEVNIDVSLNKQFNRQSSDRWFKAPWREFYTVIGKPVVGLAALKTAMMTNGKNYHTMYDTKPNIKTQTTGIH